MLGAIGVASPMGVAGAALECTTDIETEWPSVFNPVVSDDGTRIAFESFGDLTGDNPDGNLEVFVHDTTEPSLVQVSDGPGHDRSAFSTPPSAATGATSPTNPGRTSAGSDVDGNQEVFLYEIATGTTSAVTSTSSPQSNRAPDLDGDGDVIVYTYAVNAQVAVMRREVGG